MNFKKLLFVFVFSIILITSTSAFEFDNIKNYDKTAREVTIKNSFLGIPTTTIGGARLNTPILVKVPAGYQKVAEFDVWADQDYINFLKNFEFIDLNNDRKQLTRSYDLKYKTKQKVIVPDYERVCNIDLKSQNRTESCEYIESGSHVQIKEVWLPLPTTIKEGEHYTIGLFTDVKQGDYIDWMPTLYGLKVEEWAAFTGAYLYEHYNTTGNYDTTNGRALQQSFTVGNLSANTNITVIGVSMKFQAVGTINDYIIRIQGTASGDQPNSTIYYSNSFDGSSVGTGGFAWYNITLNQVTGHLSPSTQYSLVIYPIQVNDASNLLRWAMNNSPGYAGGLFTEGASNGTGAWTEPGAGGYDASFEIWGVNTTEDAFPNITFNSPPSTNYTTAPQTIQFNFTAYDDINLTSVQLFLNGSLNQTNASGANNSVYLFNLTLNDGTYTVYGKAIDNLSQSTSTATRKYIIDSTLPSISILSPTTSYSSLVDNQSIDLNYTISDLNIDTCWFVYNSITTYVNCSTNTSFYYSTNINTLTLFANDTLGNSNNETVAWDVGIIFNSFTAPSSTISGATETFSTNVTIGSSPISSVNFYYNGTAYSASSSATTGNSTLSYDLVIPGVDTTQNVTYYWSITLSSGTVVNSSNFNVTVQAITIDNCASGTIVLANLSLVDEELQTELSGNTTIEVNFEILSNAREVDVTNYSHLFNNTNPVALCLNINLTSNYKLDAIIRYTSDNYANEYYNIFNYSLSNSTIPIVITLYDLQSSDSTDFQLTFTDGSFIPVENVLVYVDRQYISENTFKTVELPKTDSNGQTILHLVRNDVIYNLRMLLNGTLIGSFQNIIAFCDDITIGDCKISLSSTDQAQIDNYDQTLGIIFTSAPVYDNTTNQITFSFTSTDGSAKTVLLTVEKNDAFGNRTVCSQSLTSSSGTITCDIGNANATDSRLLASVSVNGNIISQSDISISNFTYGNFGYGAWFILTLVLIILARKSKNLLLGTLILSYLGAASLAIVKSGTIGLGAAGTWILIVTIAAIWNLNKGRTE